MSETSPAAPAPLLVYDGRIGALYRIFLVNILLSIVTLGIWRFWAITRLRRYLWSHTGAGGERFEYDGTGGQLFIGLLLALLILFGIGAVGGIAAVLLAKVNKALPAIPLALTYLVIITLGLGAPFSAQRYRLNHTVWRGIRGGMQGSMLVYGLRSLGYVLAAVFTFYQLVPWATLRMLERRLNVASFGDARFSLHGRAGDLYLRWLLVFVLMLILAAMVFGTFFGIEHVTLLQAIRADTAHAKQMATGRLMLGLVVCYLVFFLGASLISAGYTAAFYRHVTGHMQLATLQFSSTVTAMQVLRLVLVNVLLVLVTLGFGLPIVVHRSTRFFTSNLLASGTLDPASLGQSTQPVSRFGEGMFQALDHGAGFG